MGEQSSRRQGGGSVDGESEKINEMIVMGEDASKSASVEDDVVEVRGGEAD